MILEYELRSVSLFHDMHDEEIRSIAKLCTFEEYEVNTVISDKTSEPALHIILSGQASLNFHEGDNQIKLRAVSEFNVCYEKLFEEPLSEYCTLICSEKCTSMILPASKITELYHSSRDTYAIFITNLLHIIFYDFGNASRLIARTYFATDFKMRIPVYSSGRKSYKKHKIFDPSVMPENPAKKEKK